MIDAPCTGCELCIPVCPVDCIELVDVTEGHSGWDAWSDAQAAHARDRYAFHQLRFERDARERNDQLAASAAASLARAQP